MSSIPLLCNICPTEPEFSDLSHLLTHVSSKAHLSNYFKSQVRARQDAGLREKLEKYDCWYDRYHIEKLLSERMKAKDSKDFGNRKCGSNGRARPTIPPPQARPRKRRAKNSSKMEEEASPVKIEGTIDPQLSQHFPAALTKERSDAMIDEHLDHECHDHRPLDPRQFVVHAPPELDSPCLRPLNTASRHRIHIPHMSDLQGASPPYSRVGNASPTNGSHIHGAWTGPQQDTDSESEYFRTFIRSPTRSAYPDPSDFHSFQPPSVIPSGGALTSTTGQNCTSTGQKDTLWSAVERRRETSTFNEETLPLPVLKGVIWPGMSIFDSASLDAQRQRNQKKHGGILEQMELNSLAVRQMELIYWPDGSLKKERLITGNVESSPSREPTPTAKPPKRQRRKNDKTVLADLSTNVPKLGRKPRAWKTKEEPNTAQRSSIQVDPVNSSAQKGLAQSGFSQNSRMRYDHSGGDLPGKQSAAIPNKAGSRRAFDVFRDETENLQNVKTKPFSRLRAASTYNIHGHQDMAHAYDQSFSRGRIPLNYVDSNSGPRTEGRPHHLYKDACLTSTFSNPPSHGLDINEDRENIEPILGNQGRVDDAAAAIARQRVTQRYFSVSGNRPPQFYNVLPPHMDFGGFMEPMYHGSTLNPLNTYVHQQHYPARSPTVLPSHIESPSFPSPLAYVDTIKNHTSGREDDDRG